MNLVDIPKRFTKGQLKLQDYIEEVGFEVILEKQFDNYYVDCYLPELNVAIEYDGPFHLKKRDNKRDEYLYNNFGIRVLRIVDLNKKDVIDKIKEFVCD